MDTPDRCLRCLGAKICMALGTQIQPSRQMAKVPGHSANLLKKEIKNRQIMQKKKSFVRSQITSNKKHSPSSRQ